MTSRQGVRFECMWSGISHLRKVLCNGLKRETAWFEDARWGNAYLSDASVRVSYSGESRIRGLLSVVLLAVVLAMPFSLVGCSGDAENVQSSLEDTLAAVQQCDRDTLDDLFDAVWFYPQDYGVSAVCFAEAYFEDLTYSVDDVQVKGDGAAAVDLTVSAYRMSDVLATMEAARDESSAAGADFSSEGYADVAFATMAEEAQWGGDELSVSVDLEQADDGSWAISDEATFAAVLLDGYDPRQVGF